MRFHRRVWYRALSLRYACTQRSGIILKGYLCAKSRFCRGLYCWASPQRKILYTQSLTQSITHPAYLMPGNRSFRFGKSTHPIYSELVFQAGHITGTQLAEEEITNGSLGHKDILSLLSLPYNHTYVCRAARLFQTYVTKTCR